MIIVSLRHPFLRNKPPRPHDLLTPQHQNLNPHPTHQHRQSLEISVREDDVPAIPVEIHKRQQPQNIHSPFLPVPAYTINCALTITMIAPIMRPPVLKARLAPVFTRRTFSSSRHAFQAKNRIFNPPRSHDEWSTLLLLSTSSRRPLITLWTSAQCSSCAAVLPLIRGMIQDEGVGEKEGGGEVSSCG